MDDEDLATPYFDFEPRGLLKEFASAEEIEAASSNFSFYSRGKGAPKRASSPDEEQYDPPDLLARGSDAAGTSAYEESTPGDEGPPIVKGPWSAEEDASLRELVHQHGAKRWSMIASKLPGRIGKQVRPRSPSRHPCPARSILQALPLPSPPICCACHPALSCALPPLLRR